MTKHSINWPTVTGWYLVENESLDGLVRRVVLVEALTEPTSRYTHATQRYPSLLQPGAYLPHEQMEPVQSYFTLNGKPWSKLRFVLLDLDAIAAASP